MKLMSALAVSAAIAVPAAAVTPARPFTPGLWETKATVNSVEGAGAMGLIAKMMRGKTTTVQSCITAEDAARGPQEMLKQNKSCTFTHYSMIGSQVNAEMVCQRGNETMTVVTTGTFTPTEYSGTSQMSSNSGSEMRISSTSTGKLIGSCK